MKFSFRYMCIRSYKTPNGEQVRRQEFCIQSLEKMARVEKSYLLAVKTIAIARENDQIFKRQHEGYDGCQIREKDQESSP